MALAAEFAHRFKTSSEVSARCQGQPPVKPRAAYGENLMQFLPGCTVQCINAICEAHGHWLRADIVGSDHCPSCGDLLRHVPPPLTPHFRMRPRSLAARPS